VAAARRSALERPTPKPGLSGTEPIPWDDVRVALCDAVERRRAAGLPTKGETTAFRLVHDRWDSLDGLYINRLGTLDVVHVREARWRRPERVARLAQLLAEQGAESVHIVDDVRDRHQRTADETSAELLNEAVASAGLGPKQASVVVLESGLRYEMTLSDGYSQGLFFDMRATRRDLGQRWRGRDVRNLFAYTCGFGVTLAGANAVVNVDISQRALERGRANYALNGLPVRDTDFVATDAFRYLETARRRGARVDALIIDPPAFSRGKKGRGKRATARTFTLRRDLAPLLELAMDVLAPGGELMLATNLAELTQTKFRALVSAVASARGARATFPWGPGADFPAPREHYHLKTSLIATSVQH